MEFVAAAYVVAAAAAAAVVVVAAADGVAYVAVAVGGVGLDLVVDMQ